MSPTQPSLAASTADVLTFQGDPQSLRHALGGLPAKHVLTRILQDRPAINIKLSTTFACHEVDPPCPFEVTCSCHSMP
jgi:hypothetical protein